MPVIELDGEAIAFTVRKSKRAKRIIVKYSETKGLEVVYPYGIRSPAPEAVLSEKSRWVTSTIREVREARANRFRRNYEDGEIFLVRGRPRELKLLSSSKVNNFNAQLSDDLLLLSSPTDAPLTDHMRLREAVISFYRQLATDYMLSRVAELASEHGFAYNNLRIKNQKTRWGSCSIKGNINLNLRLMMAPTDVIDYVIVHELCHLRELNHSPEFWRLVESCCSEFRHWRAWLKQNSPQLIL